MRILFLGRTRLLYDAILDLRNLGHEIAGIITAKAAPEYDITEQDFSDLANRLSVPFMLAKRLDECSGLACCRDVDLVVSVNWVSVVNADFIGMFRIGVLNLHAGDLPAYRGNACPNWAILGGEDHVCLSAHLMEGGKLDCGRIIAQRRYELTDRTTIGDVYAWIGSVSRDLVTESVEKLERDPGFTVKVASPEVSGSFRCWPRRPEDGFIDWNRTSECIDRLVRASGAPFAGAYCYVFEGERLRKLIVLEARLGRSVPNDKGVPGQVLYNNRDAGTSGVLCANGTVLELVSCRYDDEASSFSPGRRWRSIRMRLGARAEDMLWVLCGSRCLP